MTRQMPVSLSVLLSRLRSLLLMMLLAASGTATSLAGSDDGRSAQIARGSYIANGIGRCFWCHSPLDSQNPAVPRPETLGSGDILDEKARIFAPNITSDRETGVGAWTDAQLGRAIRGGVGRDGVRLRSEHPTPYFSVMTDSDLASMIAYLRSLPPIRRPVPRSAPRCPTRSRRRSWCCLRP